MSFTGTIEIESWFEEVFNATRSDGSLARVALIPANHSGNEPATLFAIKDGHEVPTNRSQGGVLFIFLTEFAYAQAMDCLRSGKRVQFRYDGAPESGYLRQYS